MKAYHESQFQSDNVPEYVEVCAAIHATNDREELLRLVKKYGIERVVFRTDKKLPVGTLPQLRYLQDGTPLNHHWEVIDPSFRPRTKPLRYPAHYEAQIADKCKEYESDGRWFPVNTDDVIPTFCVPKKDPTKARLVFDERQRNANKVPNKTPLPFMANIVERAHLAKHRSQFDLIVAYEQLRIAREQEHLSGFTTPYGAFATRVGSMGDATLPGTFQIYMNVIAGEKLGVEIHPYLDNFVIATNGTLQEHMLTLVWLI